MVVTEDPAYNTSTPVRPIPGPTATAEEDKKQEERESGLWEEGRKDRGKNCRSRRAGNRAYGRVVVLLSRHFRTHGGRNVI